MMQSCKVYCSRHTAHMRMRMRMCRCQDLHRALAVMVARALSFSTMRIQDEQREAQVLTVHQDRWMQAGTAL